MSTITIHADRTISIGGTTTGYCVTQTQDGTKVLAWHNNGAPRPRDHGDEIALPQKRYTLSSADGLSAFAADFLAAWSA